jgi:hypothetical protein
VMTLHTQSPDAVDAPHAWYSTSGAAGDAAPNAESRMTESQAADGHDKRQRLSASVVSMRSQTIACLRPATVCNSLQQSATVCNSLQQSATVCNSLRQVAPGCASLCQSCDPTDSPVATCVVVVRKAPLRRARSFVFTSTGMPTSSSGNDPFLTGSVQPSLRRAVIDPSKRLSVSPL